MKGRIYLLPFGKMLCTCTSPLNDTGIAKLIRWLYPKCHCLLNPPTPEALLPTSSVSVMGSLAPRLRSPEDRTDTSVSQLSFQRVPGKGFLKQNVLTTPPPHNCPFFVPSMCEVTSDIEILNCSEAKSASLMTPMTVPKTLPNREGFVSHWWGLISTQNLGCL